MRISLTHLNRTLALVALSSFAAAASAEEDSGWYLGAGIGHVDYADNGTVQVGRHSLAAREISDFDDPLSSSTSFWFGYRFNPYVSVEAGYLRNAETELRLSNALNETVGTFRFRSEGPTLAIVGSLPLGKWEPYARIGVMYAQTQARLLHEDGEAWTRLRGVELLASVGIAYNFTAHWQAKLEATFIPDAGERTGTGASNLGVATLGFTYRF